jgi:hypothetical protein
MTTSLGALATLALRSGDLLQVSSTIIRTDLLGPGRSVNLMQKRVSTGVSWVLVTYPKKEGNMVVSGGGLVASIVVFAVGAILRFAVTVTTTSFNVHTIGIILMIVGVVGAVLSLIAIAMANTGRRRTVIDDGRGNVIQREDTYR